MLCRLFHNFYQQTQSVSNLFSLNFTYSSLISYDLFVTFKQTQLIKITYNVFLLVNVLVHQNRDDKNCMTVLSPSYDHGALQQYTSLPGEIYDADSHCRHIFGAGSSFCKVLF